ncbi:MAG TPA: Mur ligase family protein, partial [Chitinispirillaceae bacterium]|nr:Mur ligase family protein [Chitinispirillaceae bacterium]
RLLAHIASSAGHQVGLTTTDGVYVNGALVQEGDCTGYKSTLQILQDKTVDFAVLECARGGLLKSGLAFDSCDVGIVTNVAEDHLGMKGINTIEEMAFVKSVIPESVKHNGFAILNADNDYTYAMKDRVKCHVAFFSINPKSRRIREHCRNGGLAAVYKDGLVIISEGEVPILQETVYNIPVTFDGKALFMIENVLAAMLAAWINKIDKETIIKALRSFEPDFSTTPGRMNLLKFRNFNLIIDYAHNPHGIAALGELVKKTKATQKVGIITAPGDRRELDIRSIGRVSAEIFDRIIIRVDEDTRGRKPREIIDMLNAGIRSAKKRNLAVEVIQRESDALTYALSTAIAGSLIILMSENIRESFQLASEFREMNDVIVSPVSSDNMYVLRVGKNNVYEYTKRKVNAFRR